MFAKIAQFFTKTPVCEATVVNDDHESYSDDLVSSYRCLYKTQD